MRHQVLTQSLVVMTVTLLGAAATGAAEAAEGVEVAAVTAAAERLRGNRRLVVVLEVQNQTPSSETTIPDIDGDGADDNADLCIDGFLVDPRTGHRVGTGKECLSITELGPIATTTFNFPRGTLVARGKMNLGPLTWLPEDNPDVDDSVGELSGYFPAPGTNNILSGTRGFHDASGRVRLSGAARDNGDGTFNLDCIFIIEFD